MTSVACGPVTHVCLPFDLAGEAAASPAEALFWHTCEEVQNRERRFLKRAATCS